MERINRLQVNDLVRRSATRTGKIYQICFNKWQSKGGQVKVMVLTHDMPKWIGQKMEWYYDECLLISDIKKEKSQTCNCPLEILMRKGCQCGKI